MRTPKARKGLPHLCEYPNCNGHLAYVVSVLKLEPDARLDSTWMRAFCAEHFLQVMPNAGETMTMPLRPNPAKISRYPGGHHG